MRVAIVEDQQSDADKLKEYLNKCSEELGVEFELLFFENGDIFLQNFKPDFYQVVFLDVYTQSELNGMEVAHKMRELDKSCQIIFVTTSKEFGVESYEIQAFDYLLKPYEYERLHECISRLVREMKSVSYYIELKVGRIFRKILLDEVIYTDYNNHYVQLHTEHEVLRSYMPFDELAGMLKPYKQFLNCYRNCFVNMDHIVNLDNKDFVLSSGERMPMFRKEKNELKQIYADYLFNKMKNG
jgi:DNA-binding LytR/AlgR family response regulator